MKKKKESGFKKLVIIAVYLILIILILGAIKFYGDNIKHIKVESRVNELAAIKNDDKVDAVAWLMIPGTDIDYPVKTTPDEQKYQDGDLQFLWEEGEVTKDSNLIIVQGHNIMNLSSNPLINDKTHKRFEQLMGYTYQDFAREYEYIQLTIDNENYLYKVYGVSYVNSTDASIFNLGKTSEKTVKNVITLAKNRTIFDFDVDVNKDDKLLVLQTCTRMFGTRDKQVFRVDARRVRENEEPKRYNVKVNDKYKDVEERMKGVDENEKEEA